MTKKVAYQKETMSVCLEKFTAYADPRHITLFPETYGFYEVRRNNTKKVLGAVKAVKEDGTIGWVINWADKKRKFIAASDSTVVVGRQVSATECHKAHKPKRPAAPAVDDEDDDFGEVDTESFNDDEEDFDD